MAAPFKIKGRYEIRQVLGQGGMGVVYRAYDTLIKREVALKTIRDIPDRNALDLFYKECDVLASISHPNIVEIFDIGEFEEEGADKPYFVMPLLPGVTLDHLIRTSSQRLAVDRCVDIMCQTCRGLQAAHDRGLVHRDLKPSNIFVMEDDSVKIIDCGVAHMVDARSTMGHKGTLLYMSPEQIELKPPSALSDVFSLGVVFYETFTGRRPFERPSTGEIAQAILHLIPPPASDLNPAVTPSISRVIHKAMAKQPWHRFSSAREFAETLQKAQRNEPIDFFDPARTQPCIQRATRAFEQADYQFASEILSELEAEGHVDPAISLLRRQIDQAVRQKTILNLLDSARTRFEEEEYPLALQKVQEVLQLDPHNAAALSLKSAIENKRSESKIDDWFRLARQHLENHAFSHARQALQNVLELRPKEPRALHLLSEVSRKEQEYVRVRQEKEQLYQASLEAWQNGEVSVALTKLERLLELDRKAPDTAAPERSTAYQNFYNQVRTEHDVIKNSYAEARQHLEGGNFAAALAICDEHLARHPGQALFQALQFDIEERQRQGLSARIAEIDRQMEAEPDLERKVNILKEAVEQYSGESHFERALRLMCDKRDLVNSIVVKGRNHEERGQFAEALGQWEILRTIYAQYPGLSFEIERVTKRREQQVRREAKVRWVEQIDRQLESADHGRALELLRGALGEFPEDAELLALERLARQGLDRTADAAKLLASGQEACAQGRVEEGMEALRKAYQLDERNPAIRAVLLNTLVERARAVLEADWRAAEELIQQALDLEPTHGLAKSLRTLVLDRKREEFVDQCVSQARQLQAAGNLHAAVGLVREGLSSYPREPRLAQLSVTLTKLLAESQRLTGTRSLAAGAGAAAEPGPSGLAELPEEPPAAPAGPSPARQNDLEELGRLDQNAETIDDPAQMRLIAERARAIARQYPDDLEIQQAATGLEAHLATATRRLQPVPEPAGPPTAAASPPPAPRPGGARKLPRWILPAAATAAVLVVGVFLVARRRPVAPVAGRIAVEVRTTPPGATIRINNEARGKSDLKLELPAGTYQLEAQLEGFQPAVSSIHPTPGAPVAIELALQPLPQSVRLFTDLDSGRVTLDDQPAVELQEGQLVLDNVAAGKHTLKVSSGRQQATINFEVTPGAPPAVTGPVEAKELLVTLVTNLGARAHVESSFGPVKLRLDAQPAGEVGPGGLDLNSVTPGEHELILGEGKAERKMIVSVGPAPTLTIKLGSDRNVGTLVVVTGEDDVQVFLNDVKQRRMTRRGQLRLQNLAVRDYVVRVFKDGFQAEPEQRAQISKGG